MIFVTGDTHIPYTAEKVLSHKMQKSDFLIVCGDFGLIWNWTHTGKCIESNPADERWEKRELEFLQKLDHLPGTILFVDGNHENFDRLSSYPVSEWNGGKVHRITDSVIHLMRGQVFTIEEKKIFTFGGAASHDRGPATGTELVDEGVCWWPEELCSQEERDEALANLARCENSVGYIVTHCLPDMRAMQLGFSEFNVTTGFLQRIEETVRFERWFCGHYHADTWASSKIRVLYNDVVPISEGFLA